MIGTPTALLDDAPDATHQMSFLVGRWTVECERRSEIRGAAIQHFEGRLCNGRSWAIRCPDVPAIIYRRNLTSTLSRESISDDAVELFAFPDKAPVSVVVWTAANEAGEQLTRHGRMRGKSLYCVDEHVVPATEVYKHFLGQELGEPNDLFASFVIWRPITTMAWVCSHIYFLRSHDASYFFKSLHWHRRFDSSDERASTYQEPRAIQAAPDVAEQPSAQQASIGRLQAESALLQSELDTARTSLSASRDDASCNDSEISAQQASIGRLQAEIALLQSELDTARTSLSASRDDASCNDSEVIELEMQDLGLADLPRKIGNRERYVEQLPDRICDLYLRSDEFKEEISELESEIQDLENQLDESESQLDEACEDWVKEAVRRVEQAYRVSRRTKPTRNLRKPDEDVFAKDILARLSADTRTVFKTCRWAIQNRRRSTARRREMDNSHVIGYMAKCCECMFADAFQKRIGSITSNPIATSMLANPKGFSETSR